MIKHPLGFSSSGLSFQEMHNLHDALRTIAEVAMGLGSQPRFSGEQPYSHNLAGEQIEALIDCLHGEMQALQEAAHARAATTPDDIDRKFALIAHGFVDGLCAPDVYLAEIAKIAVSFRSAPAG